MARLSFRLVVWLEEQVSQTVNLSDMIERSTEMKLLANNKSFFAYLLSNYLALFVHIMQIAGVDVNYSLLPSC